jgi:hypothetical protein
MKRAIFCWLGAAGFLQAAGLDFETLLQEIHMDSDAAQATADFKFTNTSDKPLSIMKYDAACSCMGVTISGGKLRYAPGESGVVRATFHMGNFSGTVDKSVVLWMSGDPQGAPSKQLTVRVHIPVLVEVTPKTLQWDVDGAAKSQSIRVVMNHKSPIQVTQVTSSSEAFTHELKTITAGKEYEIVVTPTATKTPGLAVFRIETDCEISRHRIQQAFAVIRRPAPGAAVAAP